jgi:hypothetical protein
MSKKRIVMLTVAALALTSVVSLAAGGYKTIQAFIGEKIKLTVNGKQYATTDESIIYQGRLYLPIRDVADAMGAKQVAYDPTTSTIDFKYAKSLDIDGLIDAGMYQYLILKNNEQLKNLELSLRTASYASLKTIAQNYLKLRDTYAVGMNNKELNKSLTKVATALEGLRQSLTTKTKDIAFYKQLYSSAAKGLNTILVTGAAIKPKEDIDDTSSVTVDSVSNSVPTDLPDGASF